MQPAAVQWPPRTTRADSTTCRPTGTRRNPDLAAGPRTGFAARRAPGTAPPGLSVSNSSSNLARAQSHGTLPRRNSGARIDPTPPRCSVSNASAKLARARSAAKLPQVRRSGRLSSAGGSQGWQRRNRTARCRRAMPSPPPPLRSATRRGGGPPSSTPHSTRTSLRTTPSPRPSRRRSARRRRWRRRQPRGRCRRVCLAGLGCSSPHRAYPMMGYVTTSAGRAAAAALAALAPAERVQEA